jgi:glycosyltransferase involved in cell wall biosynthesis
MEEKTYKIEVLISTMHQKDISLVEKMNIQTDAVIINQCDQFGFVEENIKNKRIRMYLFNERGVAISRNNALMRATGDICVLADDDVVYVNNYENLILDAFNQYPDADVILFNVPSTNPKRPSPYISRNKRIRFFEFMKYGSVNIAFKRKSILKANIHFSNLFGSGAQYSSGEDSLFLRDCLQKKLKVYTNQSQIAKVNQQESTWFKGFSEKYFMDKGALFAAMSKRLCWLLILQFAIRKHKIYKNDLKFNEACKCLISGMREFLKNDK